MNPLKIAFALLAAAGTTAALAAPMTYTLDPNHSFVHFGYSHMGFSDQEQRFNKVTGTITYDPQAQTASVDATIDLKSIDTGSVLNEHIQGADFFDTAQYPTATFKSTSVKFQGDQPVSVSGDLTIKGVTHPVTLMIEHFHTGRNMMKKPALGADAVGHVMRTEYNMGKYVPMVGNDVTIRIDLEAMAH